MRIIKKVEELEDSGLWLSALNILNREMDEHPNKAVAIRLAFVCWYTLIEWGCLDLNEKADQQEFESRLKTITNFLLENYYREADVNFYLGYMISLCPWLFSEKVDEWESKAQDMLACAVRKEPANAVYQMVYLANRNSSGCEYSKWCEKAKPLVEKEFEGNGEFNLYFRQVLSR